LHDAFAAQAADSAQHFAASQAPHASCRVGWHAGASGLRLLLAV
jgi:hypothetical protein